MKKTILVAGATGTNGRALIDELCTTDHEVKALVRDPEAAGALARAGVQLVAGDLSDRDSLVRAFDGCSDAFVAAALHQDNLLWFDNFFAAAKQAGVAHVVKLSGLGADEGSDAELLRLHGAVDSRLQGSGLSFTILRPNSFFQNMLDHAGTIEGQGAFYMPVADARQSCIDVRDIAAVAAKALIEEGHENKIYDLTGPEGLSYADIADQLGKALKTEVLYVPVPPEAARDAMLGMGMPEWLVKTLGGYLQTVSEGRYAGTTDTVREVLGREPRTFAQFAVDFADAFKA